MATTVPELLAFIEKELQNPQALNDHYGGKWHSISTNELIEKAKQLACALRHLGIKKGDRVGIMSHPSSSWTIADLAILLAGGISVPLFANIAKENFIFQVSQAEISFLFLAGNEAWDIFLSHFECFETLVLMREDEEERDPPKGVSLIKWEEFLQTGKSLLEKDPSYLDEIKTQPDDPATIIYTSGSTGVPKGALLTHRNVASILTIDPFQWERGQDRYLSVLPLAHVYARALNFFMLGAGISIYYCNQLKVMADLAKEVRPTILVVVPRILEKVLNSMLTRIQSAPFLKRTIALWAIRQAKNPKNSWWLSLKRKIADFLVYKHLREALGGCLVTVVSGGAHLNPEICQFYHGIGIPIYEGWGLTEAAPVTVNRKNRLKIGTVGPPLAGFELKISPIGEVLVKGPLVMQGYYKNEGETNKAFDNEGWLKTGDRGIIDQDGFLTILGRIKELYKTSTGEYVAPIPIEEALCQKASFLDMALVIAENRRFVSCLLFPDFVALQRLKKEAHLETLDDEAFLKTPFMLSQAQKLIKEVNKHLNQWERIHAFRFVLTPPTIETGELTPSMKLKKQAIVTKYHDLIEAMYT